MGTKLLIIGLDGATFDLIRPWAAEGKLPNLKALLDEGTHGPLVPTVPPMTFPSWNTFMTGKNPAKHGIYDFTERRAGTLEIQLVNARHRRSKTIWKLLSDAGKRVGVIGVPVCYPPEPINGAMIGGFDAPVALADEKVMHPPELCRELKEAIGGYAISADIVPLIAKGKIEEATAALEAVMEQKAAAAKYLLRRESWDCFMIMFGETDACVHYFWRYHDRSSPHYDPNHCDGVQDPILAVYQKADQMIGELLSHVNQDATIMLVSDHGTGGAGDAVVHMNRWLEHEGFLTHIEKGLNAMIYGRLLHWGKSWLRSFLPKGIINRIRFGDKQIAYKLESKVRFGSIDWSRTMAFSEETPYYPQIWINLKGREPYGKVEPGAEYEALRQTIMDRLSRWRDPKTGEKVIRGVYRREEIYQGPYLDRAPDLLIRWNEPGGEGFLFRPSSASSKKVPIERLGTKELWSSKFMINRSGCHREEGIFLLKGPAIKASPLKEPWIGDLAPTILYLMGLSVPQDMDGKVITEIFEDRHLQQYPISYGKADQGRGDSAGEADYSEEESAKVSERLQDLGYLG